MQQLVDDIAEAVKYIDRSGVPFKSFLPGVGPYGEPQLVKLITKRLSEEHGNRYKGARTCRTPDVLIPGRWALEFKIVRPFGDNGIEAEHWSQNLLHPYRGNVSAIGDAIKLAEYDGAEQRGIIVICYEHESPRIQLSVLLSAFELITRQLLALPLSERYSASVLDCIHPVHQRATIYGWPLGSMGGQPPSDPNS
jgi:hypothetical protein